MVRPDAIAVTTPANAQQTMRGRVKRGAFRGADLEYSIESSGGSVPAGGVLRALARAGDSPFSEGTEVALHIDPAAWVVLGPRDSLPVVAAAAHPEDHARGSVAEAASRDRDTPPE
jgi:hypothetical protein